MKKSEADQIISQYVKKLFGFAVSKLSDIHEAEELAEDITLTVYETLLARDNIENINGYIYKIACNVYARYIDGRNRCKRIDGIEYFPDERNIESEMIQSEEAKLLRREITYLSEMQRKIVLLHYFHDKKIKEIAGMLNLSENTVKWYLACSRKELNMGMEKSRMKSELGIEPINLCNLGHCGRPGNMGDTSDFLKKSLTQNIVYCAYYEAKTVNEIAEDLGVNPLFVRDEVEYLEEYGFMDKLRNGKYRSNILIYLPTDEKVEQEEALAMKYAEILAKEYFAPVLSEIKEIPEHLEIPDNNINLLRWSLIPFMASTLETGGDMMEKFSVKRKDGGDYVAMAVLEREIHVKIDERYMKHNQMWRDGVADQNMPFSWENRPSRWESWQLSTYWDDRSPSWTENKAEDYVKMYLYLCGELAYNELNISAYQRLIDKGYLIKKDKGFKVNVILSYSKGKWFDMITPGNERIKELAKRYCEEHSKILLRDQPEHVHELIRFFCQQSATVLHTRVMKILLDMGVLKEPSEEQRNGLCTVMFLGE